MPCDMPYGKAVLIAFDQLANTLLKGWPDETVSSRSWRWHISGKRHWPCKMIDTIFFWDRDKATGKRHCELSFISEREDRHLPPEARSTQEKKDGPANMP